MMASNGPQTLANRLSVLWPCAENKAVVEGLGVACRPCYLLFLIKTIISSIFTIYYSMLLILKLAPKLILLPFLHQQQYKFMQFFYLCSLFSSLL